jgi:pilus assembly protein Flp/PilA
MNLGEDSCPALCIRKGRQSKFNYRKDAPFRRQASVCLEVGRHYKSRHRRSLPTLSRRRKIGLARLIGCNLPRLLRSPVSLSGEKASQLNRYLNLPILALPHEQQPRAFFGRAITKMASEGQIMIRYICRFWNDQSGATAIEYGLIAAGIAVAIIATVQALGTNLNATFSSVSTALK